MEWKTRVTELLGCKYPILLGAMGGLGTWELAAAVANAGCHGTITASTSRTPEKLREDIKRCRNATSGSFGVNLSIGICPQIEEMLEVCAEEGVPVETSVYKPDALAPRIKEAGLKWIHKAARVKDATHVEHLGVDAIIIVGLEGAGIKNPEQLPTMTTTLWGAKALSVPLIAAGGIGDARGFLAALAMGAEGVMLGTALMATKDCPVSDKTKEAIVKTGLDNPGLRQRVMVPGDQSSDVTSSGSERGGEESGSAGSFAVGVIDHVPTVKELIDSIVHDAEKIVAGWCR